ncbi:hypothetical protein VKS41_005289 [Umbelopsis sp. WA50703]|jgi:small subunit ribosomal protein S7
MASALWNGLCNVTKQVTQRSISQQLSRPVASQSYQYSQVATEDASTEAATTTTLIDESIVTPPEQEFLGQNPIVSQLVNTVMRDGKKARAQRLVSDALQDIRLKTNSDPLVVLTEAIESTSPMLKLTSAKKGSKVIHVPTALRERQRRRKAIVWILEGASKRPEKTFEARLSGEILAVINGASSALTKKNALHKLALANRANAQVSYNTNLR